MTLISCRGEYIHARYHEGLYSKFWNYGTRVVGLELDRGGKAINAAAIQKFEGLE